MDNLLSVAEGGLAMGLFVAAVWMLASIVRPPESNDVMALVRYRIGCISGAVACFYGSLCLLSLSKSTGMMILGYGIVGFVVVMKLIRRSRNPAKK
jgi:hypothetical protein